MPFPSPGDLPDPGIEPGSPALQAYSLPFELLKNLTDILHPVNSEARIQIPGVLEEALAAVAAAAKSL